MKLCGSASPPESGTSPFAKHRSDREQDDDFKIEIAESDKLDDQLREMQWLGVTYRPSRMICISIPETPEDKLFLKTHKAQRKFEEKRLQM